jgi:hypothetical protein
MEKDFEGGDGAMEYALIQEQKYWKEPRAG